MTANCHQLNEFKAAVPARQRNQFVVELIERELRRLRLLKAWDEAGGAWSDEDYPDLKTREDIDQRVRSLRQRSMPKAWDEIMLEDTKDGRPSTGHEYSDLALAPSITN
ncbi:MAG: hypothetical protein M3Q45_09750 [Chloroflexota bacterium]|nr:hypothetical protein [Chloroflexota bacterium]